MTTDIVLWLDLAEANRQSDADVLSRLPSTAPILRLSDHGAEQWSAGTPPRWRPALDAIDRLIRSARRLVTAGSSCRFWVTGRAGLPAFVYLGWRLSKWAAVTIVHQPKDTSPVTVMPLDVAFPEVGSERYFERTPREGKHPAVSVAVALAVSSRIAPTEIQIQSALAARQATAGHVILAHAERSLEVENAATAMYELELTLRETCNAHPGRSALALFVAGPTSLAFLAGAAMNPRVCRDV